VAAISAEAAAKTDVETIATKESEQKSASTESEKAIKDAESSETTQKETIKSHAAKEADSKAKSEARSKRVQQESKKKEGDAKKDAKDKADRAQEKTDKATEVTAKAVEKTVKEATAETNAKAEAKKQLWAEQQSKAKTVSANQAQEKQTKADCSENQEREKELVRFTMATDKIVEAADEWQNFGSGYEGIRLQKQGNLCLMSGIIRESSESIRLGVDKGKQFWQGEMETLIQTGESSGQIGGTEWGELATVGGHCKPTSSIELLANNHVEVTKVKIGADGKVSFVSGGSRHGWVSLSGLAWKAGGPLQGRETGNSVATIGQFKNEVVFQNAWKGENVDVYKQGHVCFLSGKIQNGRNFEGAVMTLPTACRPTSRKYFMFAHDKETFAVMVDTAGAVRPLNVNDSTEKTLDLNSIAFSTIEGEDIKLNSDKGWKVSSAAPKPTATRQGSLCVLSGTAHNTDVREGTNSLLQNSAEPAILPEWCRPRNRMAFSTVQIGFEQEGSNVKASSMGVARIDILANGAIRWVAGKRQKDMNLDGIKFDVRANIVQKFSKALLKVSECDA